MLIIIVLCLTNALFFYIVIKKDQHRSVPLISWVPGLNPGCPTGGFD